MIKVEFNYDYLPNKVYHLKQDFINICQETTRVLNITKEYWFECTFVNQQTIHDLNLQYRHKDMPTDVISFALTETDPSINLLGEIFISIDQAILQAQEYQHSFRREICFLFIHGLLHILGYDHIKREDEKIMFELQDKILNSLNIKRRK